MHPSAKLAKKYLTIQTTRTLLERFQDNPFLQKDKIHQLARSFNISKKVVNEWYINRRVKSTQAGLLVKGEEFSTKLFEKSFCKTSFQLRIDGS